MPVKVTPPAYGDAEREIRRITITQNPDTKRLSAVFHHEYVFRDKEGGDILKTEPGPMVEATHEQILAIIPKEVYGAIRDLGHSLVAEDTL